MDCCKDCSFSRYAGEHNADDGTLMGVLMHPPSELDVFVKDHTGMLIALRFNGVKQFHAAVFTKEMIVIDLTIEAEFESDNVIDMFFEARDGEAARRYMEGILRNLRETRSLLATFDFSSHDYFRILYSDVIWRYV